MHKGTCAMCLQPDVPLGGCGFFAPDHCYACCAHKEIWSDLGDEAEEKKSEPDPVSPEEFARLHFKAAVTAQYRRYRKAFDHLMEVNGRAATAVRFGVLPSMKKEVEIAQADEKRQTEDLLMLIGGLLGQYDEESNARMRKFAMGLLKEDNVTWVKPVDAQAPSGAGAEGAAS